jgi:hypothetical protein
LKIGNQVDQADRSEATRLKLRFRSVRQISSSIAVIALGAIIAMPAQCQESLCLHRTLPITLSRAEGSPAAELRAVDLQPESKAGPLKIVSLTPDDRPHRIVLIVDSSSSMASVWRKALFLPFTLAKTGLPNTTMALVVFDEKVRETLDFSTPQSKIVEKIDHLGVSGHSKTAIYDAILQALQLLDRPSSADSLYIVTDGFDTAIHTRFEYLMPRASSSGVRLFVSFVLAGRGNRNTTPEELNSQQNLADLARITGGESNSPYPPEGSLQTANADQTSRNMQPFFLKMAHNYRIEIELPAPTKKPTKWELKLSDEGRARFGKAELNYPRQLAPCQP